MKIVVQVQKGPHKQVCDDAALVGSYLIDEGIHQFDDMMPSIIAVADGVGGMKGGREASHFVLSYLSNIEQLASKSADELTRIVNKCNNSLLDGAKRNPVLSRMATTLTGVAFGAEKAMLIQLGNTRLYGMPGSYLKQISTDQTTYQALLNMGQIDAAESCNKSEIVGCLGGGNPEFAKRTIVEEIPERLLRNILVLTSDGIHEYVEPDIIEAALESGDDKAAVQKIVDTANAAGSKDDKTVIIVRL